jgi:cytoskeletal protein CcmA (bactofilin family)
MDATVIDTKSEFQGKLTGRDARILGRLRGEIELTGKLETAEGSRVEARVKAETVEIGGQFDGELAARRVTLLETARVTGTVHSEGLCVREGALLDGAVDATGLVQGSGDKPPRALPLLSSKGVAAG